MLDSVRFALGELSSKELRGASFNDIIHKNSPQLQSRSAWVGIQFDNSDRRIPVEATVVTISREFRRGGEGIYRLNGRRISRKQLTDVLSSADIQVTGYNLIPQHAITRLAEVTAEERRKIIEDMIGIGVYDLKKEEAQKQLSAAETNLRVASARIEEVRVRVESLEQERNNFLRHASLKQEITRLEAKLISRDLKRLREELKDLQTDTDGKQTIISEIRKKREELNSKREIAESKRRQLEQEIAKKGSDELFEIERQLSNTTAKIAGLLTQIESKKVGLRTAGKQKAAYQLRLNELSSRISQAKEELAPLQKRNQGILSSIEEKQQLNDTVSEKVRVTRERLGEDTGRIEQIEEEIEKGSKQLFSIETEIAGSSTKIKLLENEKQALEMRSTDYSRLIEEINARLNEITRLREEEQKRIMSTSTKLEQNQLLMKMKEEQIREAAEISKKARMSLVEFETQEELFKALVPEEKALRRIEEMATAGAVSGVYGRLRDLIKINEKCLRAAESASAGWMTALVVRDVETAMTCAEILKRTKLGKIKIIPAASVAPIQPIERPPIIAGIVGRLVDFIECPNEARPALNFVFGDTVLAEDQKAAFLASIEGFRAVVLTGDVYEPGGGMETGYFREPFDLNAIVPRSPAIQDLGQTLHSLEALIEQGESEMERLTMEVSDLRQTETRGKAIIDGTTRQMMEIRENFQRAKRFLESTKSRVKELTDEIEREFEKIAPLKASLDEIRGKLVPLQKERSSLRLSVKSAYVAQLENEMLSSTHALNELKREQIDVQGKISTLRTSIDTLNPALDQIRIQFQAVCREIETTEKSLSRDGLDLNTVQSELKSSEMKKAELVASLSSIRELQDEVQTQLSTIQVQINQTYEEYEAASQACNLLLGQIKEKEAQISVKLDKLRDLGQGESEISVEAGLEKAETTLEVLHRELEKIGYVNQLAPQQYEEVVGNYKQLSVKINELEREKLAIVSFMNELDQKKRDAFMNALGQINKNFQETFSDISSGGHGRLALENLDNPLEGGLDMLLQFPNKAELGVSSASGGEKSVATVCFLLALQNIRQLPFYIFDEIDAHLDDLNSQRLADLLKSRSKNSQFMVISLRDTTVSRANRVYGVFVQDGTSQVVSIPAMVAAK